MMIEGLKVRRTERSTDLRHARQELAVADLEAFFGLHAQNQQRGHRSDTKHTATSGGYTWCWLVGNTRQSDIKTGRLPKITQTYQVTQNETWHTKLIKVTSLQIKIDES